MKGIKTENLVRVSIVVNGVKHEHDVEPRMLLVDFIRDVLGLTGTHIGCEEGICGACTVEVDGKAVKSCMMLAVQADGSQVTTIEGLAKNGELHPVQKAFQDHHAIQCGYCTPGMIMSAKVFLDNNSSPTEEEVRKALVGNLCRCTGYQNIIQAVIDAANDLNGRGEG